MRTLLAAVIFLGGLSALNSTAEAQSSQECQQARNGSPRQRAAIRAGHERELRPWYRLGRW